ncbi:hypothetical protein I503_03959 [Candida albicans SC5314]|nr:hypothetical protein MEU_03877 [Candida albicans P37005]KHC60969.1 hypothetical protein MGE_03856 [Candida albicans P75010]KHC76718.1 hypothetical protein W5Q_03934 [Candida albicans SC5314]KHC86271.1 hypothetical protein I503_03959 [Candida albicans SC5314]
MINHYISKHSILVKKKKKKKNKKKNKKEIQLQ